MESLASEDIDVHPQQEDDLDDSQFPGRRTDDGAENEPASQQASDDEDDAAENDDANGDDA